MISVKTRQGETVDVAPGRNGEGIWIEYDGHLTFISATVLAAMAEHNSEWRVTGIGM
jgi:hypothetical protein